MITYSFIIPHKNNPDLLQRCLDSIPKRYDIQIIVVDDNSDEDKKPQTNRSDIEIVLLDANQSNGAGHARNVGIERAIGKWLLFADADDFYMEGFLSFLDDCSECHCDVTYFSANSVNSKTLEPLTRTHSLQSMIKEYDGSEQSICAIKYKFHAPWNKMINANFISKNKIQFEEVLQGNDTMFSYMVGYYSKNIKVIPQDLYTYTYTENSITTKKKDMKHYLIGLTNFYKQRTFLRYIGKPDYTYGILYYFYRSYKMYGVANTIKILILLVGHFKDIRSQASYYVKLIQLKDENL